MPLRLRAPPRAIRAIVALLLLLVAAPAEAQRRRGRTRVEGKQADTRARAKAKKKLRPARLKKSRRLRERTPVRRRSRLKKRSRLEKQRRLKRHRNLLRRRGQRKRARPRDLVRMRQHVVKNWSKLTRNMRDAVLGADPKFKKNSGKDRHVVYISPHESVGKVREAMKEMLSAAEMARVEVKVLDPSKNIRHQEGLLWVPNPYVVPGGRFNEMYGWDSHFIVMGLLRDGQVDLARQMTENHLYQVEHYGKVLNANRTWSITRSQPPLLTQMVLEVYRKTGDKRWLNRALKTTEKYHKFWVSGERKTDNGLSRFFDDGAGPPPEVTGSGPEELNEAARYFEKQAKKGRDVSRYYDVRTKRFTEHFNKGTRANRESGYDTVGERFGMLGADTHHYNPADLNSMLYVMERDMAKMARLLGKRQRSDRWGQRAKLRKKKINRVLWDSSKGMYFDYNFKQGKRSEVVFASTFFPLWAGVATKQQAAKVVANLHLLEAPGGLKTSMRDTGHQWDGRIGWAPLLKIAVTGLRNYGYNKEADRITINFLSMVLKEYKRTGEIYEKYDVVERTANTQKSVRFGYTSNQAGFGWTNGVVAELLHQLPKAKRDQVLELDGVGTKAPAPAAAAAP